MQAKKEKKEKRKRLNYNKEQLPLALLVMKSLVETLQNKPSISLWLSMATCCLNQLESSPRILLLPGAVTTCWSELLEWVQLVYTSILGFLWRSSLHFIGKKNRNNIFTYCLLCYRNFPTHWRIFRSSPPSLLSPLPEGTHVNHADKLTESNRGSNWQTSGMIHRFERIILSRFINLTTEFQSVSSSEGFAKGWGRGLGGRMRNGFLGRFGSFEVSPGRLGFREGRGFTKCVFEASCCCLKSLWMIHVAGVLLRDVANASRMIHDASSSTDCFG